MPDKPVRKKVRAGIYKAWRERPAPGWYYIYDIRLDGRRVRTPRGLYFPTIKECQDAIDSLRTDHRRGVYRFPADEARVTIAQVRDLWLSVIRARKRSAKYITATEYSFQLLSKVIALTRPVKELRTEDLAELARRREEQGAARSTTQKNLVPIRCALKHAQENMAELADWHAPKSPEGMRGQVARPRSRLITYEEEAAILEYLRSNPTGLPNGDRTRRTCADVFEMALQTGMRLRELVGLKKSDVHLGRAPGYVWGWIVAHGKGGFDRTVPLNEESARIVASRLSKSELIFDLKGGVDIESRTALVDRKLGEACEAADIPYGRATAGGLVFHDCRHTVITRLLQNGADLATVMDLVGHKSPSTTLRVYSHATANSKTQAIAGLARGVPFESISPGKTEPESKSGKTTGRVKS